MENPTKYFLSLEKRNDINQTVNKLMHVSGSIITQAIILKEIQHFYTDLYSSNDRNLHPVEIANIVNKENVNMLSLDFFW